MSQAFITPEKVLEYFKKKHSHLAGSARDLLKQWQTSGDILAYTTEPLYLDGSEQAATKSAIRLNPESVRLQALIQTTYAASPSSWMALDPATKEYMMSTLTLLTDQLPFLTWGHLRVLLSKQDKETDWDTAIATAIWSGIVTVTLRNVENQSTHGIQTVKSLSLNKTNAEVTTTVAHATSDLNEDSGWQYARRSFAKLFKIG
jgi:hypothetical protein